MPIDVNREREALDWYERRRGEFMSAVTLAHNQSEDEQLLALAESFAPFFARRSYWNEGEQVLGWAVEAAARVEQPHTLAGMLNELGNIHRLKSDFGAAAEEFDGALSTYRELGDSAGQASALSNLGLTLRKLGQTTQARGAFEESLRLWSEVPDIPETTRERGRARGLNNLAMTLLDLGEPASARELFQQALRIREEIGDADGVSRTLNNLGQLLLGSDPSAAIELHRRALEIRSELNDRHGVARTSGLLATALTAVGRTAEAHQLLADALEIRQALGDRYGEAETNLQDAGVALAESNFQAARTHAEQALSIADDLRVPRQAAQASRILGIVEDERGERARSAEFFDRAIKLLRESGLEADAVAVEQERPEPSS
jgi:tetratricopeptide (TPR) repeat protein